jgi:hypothetical protein
MLLVKVGGQPRLKKWIGLEQQKENIMKAVEDGDNFPDELLRYLAAFVGVRYKWYENADWILLIQAFYLCVSKSPQVDLPITTPSNEKSKDESWDYPSRTWHLYSHLLAKTYGWSLSEISQLRVEEALAKIQEIMVDDQLDREFQYGLSELAYHYDKNSKTSKFVPLPRPSWMRTKIQPIKKFLIPKSMLPVGNVISDGVLPPELMPKEIIH